MFFVFLNLRIVKSQLRLLLFELELLQSVLLKSHVCCLTQFTLINWMVAQVVKCPQSFLERVNILQQSQNASDDCHASNMVKFAQIFKAQLQFWSLQLLQWRLACLFRDS